MRCYRSARGFANDFRRRNGEPNPSTASTKYIIEYDNGRHEVQSYAPKSYRHVEKTIFVVDDVGVAERIYGLWVERPTQVGRRWLFEIMLQRVTRRLRDEGVYLSAYGPSDDTGAGRVLDRYVDAAVKDLSSVIVPRIIDHVTRRMEAAGEFAVLDCFGDSLNNPPS